MSLVAGPLWSFGLFAALMFLAAMQDMLTNKISNFIVLGLLVAGVATALAIGIDADLLQNVGILVAILILGTALFSAGILGGGDVKLIAASAFWFAASDVPRLLIAIVLAGAALLLVWLPLKMMRNRGAGENGAEKVPLMKQKTLPYGIAIAAGSLLVGYQIHTAPPPMFTL